MGITENLNFNYQSYKVDVMGNLSDLEIQLRFIEKVGLSGSGHPIIQRLVVQTLLSPQSCPWARHLPLAFSGVPAVTGLSVSSVSRFG